MVLEEGNMTLPHPPAQPPQFIVSVWNSFYEGDFQKATETIVEHLKAGEKKLHEATRSDEIIPQLIDLFILAGTSARDRMDNNAALGYLTRAKEEAERYGDIQLVVKVLISLFTVYQQAGNLLCAEAIKDELLIWTGGVAGAEGVALMGLVYICAGELYSTLARQQSSEYYATSAQRYLDAAEDAWVTLGRDTTTQNMRLTMTRIQNERATFLAGMGKRHDAERALGRAQDYLAGSNVRNKKDYYLALSGLNIANENVLGACAALSTSLTLHEETNSRSNFVYMFRDVAKLKKMAPENNAVLLIENRLRTL